MNSNIEGEENQRTSLLTELQTISNIQEQIQEFSDFQLKYNNIKENYHLNINTNNMNNEILSFNGEKSKILYSEDYITTINDRKNLLKSLRIIIKITI